MSIARTAVIEGDLYVSVTDLIAHLLICSESVTAFCSESAPLGARIVAETLNQTIDTLQHLG